MHGRVFLQEYYLVPFIYKSSQKKKKVNLFRFLSKVFSQTCIITYYRIYFKG